jgi:SAM-dependent methyltransferase
VTPTALDVYAAALDATLAGGSATLTTHDTAGQCSIVDIQDWLGGRSGDEALVSRCAGATLDVGCGPGRLVAAVAATGVPALGVDVSPTAVRLTRARGVPAVCRSVFRRLPSEGRWRHVLLADGNIGIGGDPVRLLERCRRLIAPQGNVLVELAEPGTASRRDVLRLRHGTVLSGPFRWAYLAADDLPDTAAQAGLREEHLWTEAGRWFAELVPR